MADVTKPDGLGVAPAGRGMAVVMRRAEEADLAPLAPPAAVEQPTLEARQVGQRAEIAHGSPAPRDGPTMGPSRGAPFPSASPEAASPGTAPPGAASSRAAPPVPPAPSPARPGPPPRIL